MLRNRKPLRAKAPWRPERKAMKPRKQRLNPRSQTKAYARRVRDAKFMAFVRLQVCCAPLVVGDGWACGGPIEAHHAGRRPAGQLADDRTCIALCSAHHRAWHAGNQPFVRWGREARREWADRQIAATQSLYAAATPRDEGEGRL